MNAPSGSAAPRGGRSPQPRPAPGRARRAALRRPRAANAAPPPHAHHPSPAAPVRRCNPGGPRAPGRAHLRAPGPATPAAGSAPPAPRRRPAPFCTRPAPPPGGPGASGATSRQRTRARAPRSVAELRSTVPPRSARKLSTRLTPVWLVVTSDPCDPSTRSARPNGSRGGVRVRLPAKLAQPDGSAAVPKRASGSQSLSRRTCPVPSRRKASGRNTAGAGASGLGTRTRARHAIPPLWWSTSGLRALGDSRRCRVSRTPPCRRAPGPSPPRA